MDGFEPTVLRVVFPPPNGTDKTQVAGFDLNDNLCGQMMITSAIALEEADLERWLPDRIERRHVLRWTGERVEALPDGRVRIALKRAWSDGTTALELSRLELVERLVSLVPPPRANQVHYHGVLASRSRLRGRVRPKAPKARTRPASVGRRLSKRGRGRSRWRSWSALLWRVFGVNGFACPKCGEAMTLRTVVLPPATLRVLASLGRSARGPP